MGNSLGVEGEAGSDEAKDDRDKCSRERDLGEELHSHWEQPVAGAGSMDGAGVQIDERDGEELRKNIAVAAAGRNTWTVAPSSGD